MDTPKMAVFVIAILFALIVMTFAPEVKETAIHLLRAFTGG